MPKQHGDYTHYAKRASGTAETTASPASLWKVVSAIGGDNGYYYLNSLWRLRELIDGVVGGPGLRHSRRHPSDVRLGDRIDSWEVIGVEPERRLAMAFGMRAPGSGVLEFDIGPQHGRTTRITATAYWHPDGLLGQMYWLSLEPAHLVIFKGLTREICQRAEALDRQKTKKA